MDIFCGSDLLQVGRLSGEFLLTLEKCGVGGEGWEVEWSGVEEVQV